MPHFDENGNDTVICQLCASIVSKAEWRSDLTGNKSAGNVCLPCIKKCDEEAATVAGDAKSQPHGVGSRIPKRQEGPIGIVEHCRRESGGLTGIALQRYINRHYGHN